MSNIKDNTVVLWFKIVDFSLSLRIQYPPAIHVVKKLMVIVIGRAARCLVA